MFLTIPTLLTWARIIAIPLIVGVFYLPLEAPTRNLVATVTSRDLLTSTLLCYHYFCVFTC